MYVKINKLNISLIGKVIDLKIMICDDDIKIIDEIQKYLNTFSQKHKLVFDTDAFCSSTEAAKSPFAYDMAFIDIEMPTVNGLTLVSLLKKMNNNIIIFIVTSFGCYLDEAMDLEAFRYLTKPVDSNRFYRALKTAFDRYHSDTQVIALEDYDECYTVFTKDILYITTENKRAVVVTRQGKYLSKQRISYWKDKLKDIDYLVQTHHSYIVNMRYVGNFNKKDLCIEADNQKIILPISQRKYTDFKKPYFAYIGV